jgi:diguanylate cyclase (GGDEF)-like protein
MDRLNQTDGPGAIDAPAPTRNESSEKGVADAFALDPRLTLNRLRAVVYDWDIVSDRLTWAPNAAETLAAFPSTALATGAGFAELVTADSPSSRYLAIHESGPQDGGDDVPYRAVYRLAAPGGRAYAVEDLGRWSADASGRPARAHGLMRLVADDETPRIADVAGLPERRAFARALEARLREAQPGDAGFSAAIVGIENLGELNRRYGYEAADDAIAAVGRRLAANVRAIDLVAHFAGGKFAALLSAHAEEQLAIAAARLMQRVAAEPIATSAGPLRVSVRVGAALAPQHGRNACRLLQHAEEAFEMAAGEPRRFVVYTPGQATSEARRRETAVADEILAALNQRRVVVAYQPVVAAADGRVAFYEALLRVRQEDGEIVGPAAYLPVAEKMGLVDQLDQRVLELALDRLVAEPGLRVSVNFSVATLRSPGWLDRLKSMLNAHPGAASRLIVEVVETLALEPVDQIERLLAAMKALGLKIAMDDFGAGHTSFRNLRRLGIDIVKIDGAFVQNVACSLDDRVFVRSLADLARHLGLTTVAEWVEDEEARRLLRDWGVDLLQGRLLGRPEIYEPVAASPTSPRARAVG